MKLIYKENNSDGGMIPEIEGIVNKSISEALNNVNAPVSESSAVNKKYVDDTISSAISESITSVLTAEY